MIKPIRKQVLFQPFPSKEITDGGIFIPDTCKKPSNKGTIKAVGNLVTKVKEGHVGFRVKDWGQEIMEDGILYYIMDEDSVLATD